MALQAVYKQFLAAPNSSALAQNASLHYITTLTSFYGPTDIIKHFNSTRNQIKKNKEELLNVVEGQNALAVQAELTLEFQDSGGPYLPGLDDQFLSDRTVYLPVVSPTLPPASCLADWSVDRRGFHPSHHEATDLVYLLYPLVPRRQVRQRWQDYNHPAELGPGSPP